MTGILTAIFRQFIKHRFCRLQASVGSILAMLIPRAEIVPSPAAEVTADAKLVCLNLLDPSQPFVLDNFCFELVGQSLLSASYRSKKQHANPLFVNGRYSREK